MKLTQTEIFYAQIFNCDPLTFMVRKKFKLPIWLVTILLIIILNLTLIIVANQSNSLYTVGSKTGLLFDYAWWVYQVTSVPAIILYYLWLPTGVLDVFLGLKNNKVLATSLKPNKLSSNFDNFIQRFIKFYSHWAWILANAIAVFIFMLALTLPEFRHYNLWVNSGNTIFWVHGVFWYIIFSIGSLAVLKTLLSIYWFNKLFREFETDIRVLHPDKSGGLAVLGNFSVKIGYVIGIIGFTIAIDFWSHTSYVTRGVSFTNQTSTILGIIGYIMFSPIVFFATIGTAHSAMQNAKNKSLLAISDQFEIDFYKIDSLLNKSAKELQDGMDKIEHLQKIHDLISKFPVWPFSVSNIIRFFSSTLSPIIFALLPYIVNAFLKTK